MSREAFETAALAAHPTGESSPLAAQSMRPAPIPAADGGAVPPAPAAAGGTPVVTIYGTSWCGACRAARQYFTSRKIPFADKDIEKDADAARELAAKAAKMGIPTDRVPILDVRGRLLLGFDRARVEIRWEKSRRRARHDCGRGWAALAPAGGGGRAHDRSAPGRERLRDVRLKARPRTRGRVLNAAGTRHRRRGWPRAGSSHPSAQPQILAMGTARR
jgi:glutaredoxin